MTHTISAHESVGSRVSIRWNESLVRLSAFEGVTPEIASSMLGDIAEDMEAASLAAPYLRALPDTAPVDIRYYPALAESSGFAGHLSGNYGTRPDDGVFVVRAYPTNAPHSETREFDHQPTKGELLTFLVRTVEDRRWALSTTLISAVEGLFAKRAPMGARLVRAEDSENALDLMVGDDLRARLRARAVDVGIPGSLDVRAGLHLDGPAAKFFQTSFLEVAIPEDEMAVYQVMLVSILVEAAR